MNNKVIKSVAVIALTTGLVACSNTAKTNNDTTNEEKEVATTTEDTTIQEETNTAVEKEETASSSSTNENTAVTTVKANTGTLNAVDIFTERDLQQNVDTTNATKYTIKVGEDITITEEGIYVLSGSAKDVTVTVEADSQAKVQIVLDGVSITNTDFPAIYVKSADKVFVTTTNSTNELSVTGSFVADGDTQTDATIFSKDDLVLNGLGTLTITSSDNAVVSKDDLKVTGGTYNITCTNNALRGNDSVAIADGTFNIQSNDDGIHAEYTDDDSVGYVYIGDGEFKISAVDDAIHGTTVVQIDGGTYEIEAAEAIEATFIQINDGNVQIAASDDGINAAYKSNSYGTPEIEINGGNLKITMAQGDTDALDANGNIRVTGGTIDIQAQFAFDFDGKAEYTGGSITVNGNQINQITNSMMGGGFGHGGKFGSTESNPGENNQDSPWPGMMPNENNGQFGGDFHHKGERGEFRGGNGEQQPPTMPDDTTGSTESTGKKKSF